MMYVCCIHCSDKIATGSFDKTCKVNHKLKIYIQCKQYIVQCPCKPNHPLSLFILPKDGIYFMENSFRFYRDKNNFFTMVHNDMTNYVYYISDNK